MSTRNWPTRWPRALGATATVLSLLAGCATHTPPKADEGRIKEFVGRGYLTDDRFSIATTFANWNIGEYSFDIAWTVPVSGASLPLVVYLPGLGESRNAGEGWRTAWAQAGYAVLSLQLLDEDQKVWSSAAARRGDFGLLARERFGKEATAARLSAFAALLAQLSKSHGADDALLRRLDLSRIAIAGFDVGAYTAMLVGGELPKGSAEPVRPPIPVAAIVALSPYADFSGSALSSRYQSIAIPVLSVSGAGDIDATGVVSSPSLRQAPFDYMPSRDAYLLWLSNAAHGIFSGSALAAGEEDITQAEAWPRGGSKGQSQGGSRRGGRHSGDGGSATAVEGGESPGFRGGRAGAAASSPTERALSASLIQGVTTAFLDAYLKRDAIAREWLRKDAGRWIGERGELRRK